MFETISVKTAIKLSREGRAVLYDIRDEISYQKGHLPTAKHVTKDLMESELRRNFKLQRGNMVIVLYCDYGNQSMRVAKELSEKGYRGIASMVGGYHAYEGYVEMKKNNLWTMEWKKRGESGNF